MNTNKNNKIMAAFITFAAIIILGGITFTFFSSAVSNTNNEKINTQTATMSLEFDDNDNGVSGILNLGESIVKKFTLENTGTVDAYGKINWYNLVNTYLPGSLTWTLEQSTTENGTYTTVGSGSVPTSSSATTKVLKDGLMVPVNTTYYYKLTITLNNLDIDQSSDINAHMNSKFSLEAGQQLAVDKIINLVSGEPTNTTNVITKTAPTGSTCTNTLAYDGTSDNNLRYVGANPCNYVTFNEEEAGWRIVGVMNNINDGTGNLETRIKLIRSTTLGNYSWDSSDSSINSGNGVNDWTQSDLKNELNGDYLNTTLTGNTNWYNGKNNQQTGVYDYTKGLNADAQEQIENAKWFLGGHNTDGATASTFYTAERGTNVYSGRPTDWTGKVALIYPSDFGFAVGDSVRNACLTTNLSAYNGSVGCVSNDWLRSMTVWTISPYSDTPYNVFIFTTRLFGSSAAYNTSIWVHPAVYLKSDVSITGGDGSPENPYVLG